MVKPLSLNGVTPSSGVGAGAAGTSGVEYLLMAIAGCLYVCCVLPRAVRWLSLLLLLFQALPKSPNSLLSAVMPLYMSWDLLYPAVDARVGAPVLLWTSIPDPVSASAGPERPEPEGSES